MDPRGHAAAGNPDPHYRRLHGARARLASRCFRVLSNRMTRIDFGDRWSRLSTSRLHPSNMPAFRQEFIHHVKTLFSFLSLGVHDHAIFALFSHACSTVANSHRSSADRAVCMPSC